MAENSGVTRILSRLSVETMTTDHLTPRAEDGVRLLPRISGMSRGWGFGVSMVTRCDDVAAVPGRFGWDGGYGTSFFRPEGGHARDPDDPAAKFPLFSIVCLDFWTSAYQAIDDSGCLLANDLSSRMRIFKEGGLRCR